ncbi:glycosyltransferase family 39 protein [Limibaculum sp. M0105]|uniref:Glycosyltransferase family 39 protein n=1 Tax=Thermohalobaculum xanthum TaxID=2753746 RepID=A0A8J7M8Q7_9RHOB|nr:glycosyltransferase family 39 protein [Thermohalobaculum xanthum]MBK0400193.1 glycosyltransferase family 39 protein [Thermohalobaculum xanthum]
MTEAPPSGDNAGQAETGRAPPPARIAIWLDGAFRALLDRAARTPVRAALTVLLVALAVALPGLETLPVTDRDEARFVQATKQMLESGDLVDIRFQDEPRWKKPVGIYWLQALSAGALGGPEAPAWAYRIPSALALVLGALATLWAAWPLVGARAAVVAGIALPTALLATVEGHIAKTDAALMLSAVLVFGALARALAGKAGRFTWLAFWLAMAGAILLKGPVVPAIALLAVLGVWLGLLRLPRIRPLRPLLGLALTIALVAPWLVAIWVVSEGRFFAESVGEDLIAKVQSGQESHGAPPGLYFLLVWVTFWPWAVFLPLAARRLWAARREVAAATALAWVVPFWLVLEAVPTKLPHYVLPLYPVLAIAVAAALTGDGPVSPGRWPARLSAAFTATPALVLALAVVVLPLAVEGRVIWPALTLGLAGAAFGLVGAVAALRGLRLGQAAAGVLAALALYPAALHFALPAMTTAFPSPRMAALAARFSPCASGPLMSLGYREPSLVFLTETATMLGPPDAIAARLAADPGAMVLVEDRWRPTLDKLLGDQAPALVERAAIGYFNYNRGKPETARLLTRDDPRWQPCAARQ